MLKQERLIAIKGDLDMFKTRQIRVQQPSFNHLEVYSTDTKINSVVRTLIALHGRSGLLRAASEWTFTDEGKELNAAECFMLFQAVKWAIKWEANNE